MPGILRVIVFSPSNDFEFYVFLTSGRLIRCFLEFFFSDSASGMTYTSPAEIHGFINCLEHCAIAVLVAEVCLSFVLQETVIA